MWIETQDGNLINSDNIEAFVIETPRPSSGPVKGVGTRMQLSAFGANRSYNVIAGDMSDTDILNKIRSDIRDALNRGDQNYKV